jgi:hypothetical protein
MFKTIFIFIPRQNIISKKKSLNNINIQDGANLFL